MDKQLKAKIEAWFRGAQMWDRVKVYGKDTGDIIIQKTGANEIRLCLTDETLYRPLMLTGAKIEFLSQLPYNMLIELAKLCKQVSQIPEITKIETETEEENTADNETDTKQPEKTKKTEKKDYTKCPECGTESDWIHYTAKTDSKYGNYKTGDAVVRRKCSQCNKFYGGVFPDKFPPNKTGNKKAQTNTDTEPKSDDVW